MVESVADFRGENAVELREVDDEAGRFVERARDGDVSRVGMTVETLARAESEHLLVALLRPVRTAIAMRRGEGHAASEKAGHGVARRRESSRDGSSNER